MLSTLIQNSSVKSENVLLLLIALINDPKIIMCNFCAFTIQNKQNNKTHFQVFIVLLQCKFMSKCQKHI